MHGALNKMEHVLELSMFIRLSLEWGMSKQNSTGLSPEQSTSKRSSIGLSLKWSMKDSLWNVKTYLE